ncbi:hypothetical protein VPH35_104621 [Triticum aestivum]
MVEVRASLKNSSKSVYGAKDGAGGQRAGEAPVAQIAGDPTGRIGEAEAAARSGGFDRPRRRAAWLGTATGRQLNMMQKAGRGEAQDLDGSSLQIVATVAYAMKRGQPRAEVKQRRLNGDRGVAKPTGGLAKRTGDVARNEPA